MPLKGLGASEPGKRTSSGSLLRGVRADAAVYRVRPVGRLRRAASGHAAAVPPTSVMLGVSRPVAALLCREATLARKLPLRIALLPRPMRPNGRGYCPRRAIKAHFSGTCPDRQRRGADQPQVSVGCSAQVATCSR
jgi:hypothetical protein